MNKKDSDLVRQVINETDKPSNAERRLRDVIDNGSGGPSSKPLKARGFVVVPLDVAEAAADEIKDLRRRVAELEIKTTQTPEELLEHTGKTLPNLGDGVTGA